MNNIPKKLKENMASDPFYRQCCITGQGIKTDDRFNPRRIEWHHNLQYAGKQVQEKWCILPIQKWIHDKVGTYKDLCDWIMLSRATDEELSRYSKVRDLYKEKQRLEAKYGAWRPGKYINLTQR